MFTAELEDSMPVSAASAANAILTASEERGIALDPMKLQKLLYLTNGYYAAVTGEPWINEPFEAWDYGPVLPSAYRCFRSFGSGAIKKGTRAPVRTGDSFADPKLKKVMDFVLDRYGAKSAIYLSELTHKEDSPWANVKATEEGRLFKNIDIPFSDIKNYFGKLVTPKQNA